MKKLLLITLVMFSFSSCSNMESDAKKVCDYSSQFMEMSAEAIQLSMKVGFGDEAEKQTAQKELEKLETKIEKMTKEIEDIQAKYDESEFEAYLLENCDALQNMQNQLKDFGDF